MEFEELVGLMELACGVEAVFHFFIISTYEHIWIYNSTKEMGDLNTALWYLEHADSYLNSTPKKIEDDTIQDYKPSRMIADMRDYIKNIQKEQMSLGTALGELLQTPIGGK